MKLVKTVCVILLGCLLLAGCTFKNKTLDTQTELVIEALNGDDPEEFTDLLLDISDEDGLRGYEELKEYWIPTEPEDAKLISFNINTKVDPGHGSVKTYTGIYRLPREDEFYNLRIIYVESDDGSGLTSVRLGSFADKNAASSISVVSVVSAVIYLVAAIVTIVDILRKKPGYYGVFIVIALIAFTANLPGASVVVPVGSVVYWCLRKSLLQKKAARSEDYQ